ncbi:MAG: MaoC family dehydratase [Geminicoccaceae bacterium]
MSKTATGNYLEDFRVGQVIEHATPRTVTDGDTALYIALTGSRFAVHCADAFAKNIGFERAPIDDLLTFHIVFGKTVPDISLNAVANLGYADGRFTNAVYAGATLSATSEVIGLKENSNKKTGVVYVRTTGRNAYGEEVLSYCRWVMVKKRDEAASIAESQVPELPDAVPASALTVPPHLNARTFDPAASGSPFFFEDYEIGEKIDHVDGMTVEEAEHRMATRLYQNTAKVHFNNHTERDGRFGTCIVYGGVVISIAKALSFNGLGNALRVAAINGGTHCNPCFAGDTIYAWSEVLDKAEIAGHRDLGAVRLRLVAAKDTPCGDYPYKDDAGKYRPDVLLDFDYWALLPRKLG